MFTRDDLGRLLAVHTAPAVSLFMPTHTAGREIRQDPIRFRNLLGQAVERLTALGMRRPDAEAMVTPAAKFLDEGEFWRHQDRGLAMFIADGMFEMHRLPMEPPEEVVVAQGLSVRPLLPLLAAEGAFMVLAVSASRARLFSASRWGICEEEAKLPDGVQEVHAETDYDENSLNSAPPARHGKRRGSAVSMVKTHNFGEDPEELRKAHLIEYLRRLAVAVHEHLKVFNGPTVLVAEDEIRGHFRTVSNLNGLLDDAVDANPDALDAQEIHRRAYALVEPLFTQARDKAVDQFRAVAGDVRTTGRAATRPEDIVPAARQNRVATLLLSEGMRVWGRYDEANDRVSVGGEPGGQGDGHQGDGQGVIDLVERAAADTLLNGGEVHVVTADALPADTAMAAIFRY